MKIKMLQTTKGSEDGIKVFDLILDQEYDVREKLAKQLVEGGLAIMVTEVTEVSRPDLEAIVRGEAEPETKAEPEEATAPEPSEPKKGFKKSRRTR